MFNLDANKAKAYDQRSAFINESGKYVGVIESAVWYKTPKNGGSENVILNFVTHEKQKARFFVNVRYAGNTDNDGGIKLMNALLACLRLRSSGGVTTVRMKEYNPETKQEEMLERECFTQLHGKEIGIVVQMVHEKDREYPSATIYSLFEPASEMTAGEILNKEVEPKQLSKVMAYIADHPLNDKRKANKSNASGNQSGDPRPTPPSDLDDDIPF